MRTERLALGADAGRLEGTPPQVTDEKRKTGSCVGHAAIDVDISGHHYL